jgi:subtilisin family serine protease
MKRSVRWLTVGLVALAVGLVLTPPVKAVEARKLYIVELPQTPLALLQPSVAAHGGSRASLDVAERSVRDSAGIPDAEVVYRYRTVLNGFAARLTVDEVTRLDSIADVRLVRADVPLARRGDVRRKSGADSDDDGVTGPERRAAAPAVAEPGEEVEADGAGADGVDLAGDVPSLLGLPRGIWDKLGGPDAAGEGLVIGVIDDGIVVNHPSFADRPFTSGKRNYVGTPYAPLAGWSGSCESGPGFAPGSCNNKVVTARQFSAGIGHDNIDLTKDKLSPVSIDGHGVSVAAVAAGNYGVDPVVLGNDFGVGRISGVAPRARIAAYKAFWYDKRFGAGVVWEADALAALDAAVADGVDVVNMSFGGPELDTALPAENLGGAFSRATLAALSAGVLMVSAAGNEGPAPFTTGTPGVDPWVFAAGSSTVARAFVSDVALRAGSASVVAAAESNTAGLPASSVVVGADIAKAGVSRAEARVCHAGTLEPARAAGRVLLCEVDGYLDEVATEARRVGAAGLVMGFFSPYEVRGNDGFQLPTVIVDDLTVAKMITFRRQHANATIAFSPAHVISTADTARRVSLFSSRGSGLSRDFIDPSLQSGAFHGAFEFGKPDALAPGEDILTAVASTSDFSGCPCPQEEAFATVTGTSFASPVSSGAAALVKQARPDLSAAQVLSALSLSARGGSLLRVSAVPANPAQAGSGRINPNGAIDAGLVVTETAQRYAAYLDGNTQSGSQSLGIEPHDLNRPSVVFDPFDGPRTTRRTFTSIDAAPSTWRLASAELDALRVEVSPKSFTLQPGQSQTVSITASPDGALTDDFIRSAVLLITHATDGRVLRVPVSAVPGGADLDIRPVATSASGGTGVASVSLTKATQVSASFSGVAAPVTRRDVVINQGGQRVFDVNVPAGTALFEAAVQVGGVGYLNDPTDLDLYLLRDDDGDGFGFEDVVDSSVRPIPRESTGIMNPRPGIYRILVDGFYTGGNASSTFDLTHWIVPAAAGGSGPRASQIGGAVPTQPGVTATIPFRYSGVAKPGTNIAVVTFRDTDGVLGTRLLEILRRDG